MAGDVVLAEDGGEFVVFAHGARAARPHVLCGFEVGGGGLGFANGVGGDVRFKQAACGEVLLVGLFPCAEAVFHGGGFGEAGGVFGEDFWELRVVLRGNEAVVVDDFGAGFRTTGAGCSRHFGEAWIVGFSTLRGFAPCGIATSRGLAVSGRAARVP